MTHSDSVIDVVDPNICYIINRILEVLKAAECLLITEEGKYYTNTV